MKERTMVFWAGLVLFFWGLTGLLQWGLLLRPGYPGYNNDFFLLEFPFFVRPVIFMIIGIVMMRSGRREPRKITEA